VLPAGLFLVAFFVLPMAMMGLHSLQVRTMGRVQPGLTLANYERFFAKDYLWGALANSV
jgi:ABC-type spermidine/putrescine transport system permease subunit II